MCDHFAHYTIFGHLGSYFVLMRMYMFRWNIHNLTIIRHVPSTRSNSVRHKEVRLYETSAGMTKTNHHKHILQTWYPDRVTGLQVWQIAAVWLKSNLLLSALTDKSLHGWSEETQLPVICELATNRRRTKVDQKTFGFIWSVENFQLWGREWGTEGQYLVVNRKPGLILQLEMYFFFYLSYFKGHLKTIRNLLFVLVTPGFIL